MVNGLIVTHGKLGTELVRVMEMIMGPIPGIEAMSNSGKSHVDLTNSISTWLAGVETDGALLFIDDMGGSCANAAQLAAGRNTKFRIVTGINLAMLLDFVTWREGLPTDELARRIVERGREAIILLKQTGGDA